MFRTAFIALSCLLLAAAAAQAGTRYALQVDGLTCLFCVANSERALKKLHGIDSVSTDLEAGVISVCAGPSAKLSDAKLKKLFLAQGFTYRGMRRKGSC